MAAAKAITLRFYDGSDKEIACHTRVRIPWGVLKRAIRMADALDEENISDDDLDSMASLLVDAFSGAFAVEDIDKYADINDVVLAIQAIIEKASENVPNLPPRAK